MTKTALVRATALLLGVGLAACSKEESKDLCADVACSAQDSCHEAGVCDSATGQCSNPVKADGAACDDANASTGADVCAAGVCAGRDLCVGVTCTAQDQCHDTGVCDSGTGQCSNPAKADGTACDDASAATSNDVCTAGVCAGVDLCAGVTCTAQDACHVAGVCSAATGQCSNPVAANGTACDDGNAMTTGDVCGAGVCTGSPAGATCETAPTLSLPVDVQESMLASFANDYRSGPSCKFGSGNDRVVAVDVPAGKRLYSSVRGVGSYDPSISLVGGSTTCVGSGTTCLSSDDTGTAASLNFVTVTNTGTASQRYFIVVDSAMSGAGDYAFRTTVTDPLAGDTCGTADRITVASTAVTLSGQTVDLYANDYGSGTGCSGFTGGERVYRIEVPANTGVSVTATPVADFDVAVNIIEGAAGPTPETACGASIVCRAAANAGTGGVAETAVLRNNTSASKVVFVTVEAATSLTTPGSFDLTVTPVSVLAGDACSNAEAVTPGVSLTGQSLLDYSNDYALGTLCAGTAGPDRLYKVLVPAGDRITAVVTPVGSGTSNWDPSVNLQLAAGCGGTGRVCLAGSDSGNTGESDTASWTNETGATVELFVAVEAYSATAPAAGATREFTLDVTVATPPPPPADDVCSDASTLISSDTVLSAESFVGYTSNYQTMDTSCKLTPRGPDRAYRLRIGAGRTVTVTVTPLQSWDPTLSLALGAADTCGPSMVCVASDDRGGLGRLDTFTYTNSTGADQDGFLIVDSFLSSLSTQTYSLSVTFSP